VPIGVTKKGWPAEYASLPFAELNSIAKEQAAAKARDTAE
jgi:hypothetical protein